jgi:hypothetical protein
MVRQRNYSAEHRRRIESGLARGLSRPQARGHARGHEASVKAKPAKSDERLERSGSRAEAPATA